jgi:hypothetical protein
MQLAAQEGGTEHSYHSVTTVSQHLKDSFGTRGSFVPSLKIRVICSEASTMTQLDVSSCWETYSSHAFCRAICRRR